MQQQREQTAGSGWERDEAMTGKFPRCLGVEGVEGR